jgi:hypothetical protein
VGEKLVVGPINKGLRNDRTAFVIDNDSFPTLVNAYQWRGRIKRKRGTSFLGRLTRFFNSGNASYGSIATIILDGSGQGNILTGFGLQTNGNIVPGSVGIIAPGPNNYFDPTMDGYFTPTGTGGVNTINYATGLITIPGEAGNAIFAIFRYYPDLPVMGLEDYFKDSSGFQDTIGFDTKYAYNILTTTPHDIYDISFYKNLQTATYPGYVTKTTVTPTSWNGQDYQQFWSTNYQEAFWVTNGMDVPFTGSNIGMQFKPIVAVTVLTPTTASLNIVGHGLVVGDFVFINEVITTTGINFQTGYVTTVSGVNDVIVTFPYAALAANGTGGIAQYLTSRSDITKDCIRWYDGDPTDGNALTPSLTGRKGWVNFMPPLSQASFSIADLPPAQYYLVGAKMILAFKDRFLALGAVVQASTGPAIYLQDTVIYSQNGTPYYTCSFTGPPENPTTINPILVPTNQTAQSTSWWEDQTGFGGFQSAGVNQPLTSTSTNEDVLIIGFTTFQTRFIYTGNDITPFNFFVINSEYGSTSTFSAINLDQGVITRGGRGYILTSQTGAQRVDLEIPDEVFEINLLTNGSERFTAQRDFINEWIYFTFPSNRFKWKFPNRSLQYNFRDNSWALFNECYTCYGNFRDKTGSTWATIGLQFPTWSVWNEAWNAGASTLLQPKVIAGNQQGFVLFRDDGTDESVSIYIRDITNNTVTSPDHCLNHGDFILINGVLGTAGSQVNGKIFQIFDVGQNSFKLSPNLVAGSTYLGGGLITRLYIPLIQTKQFPPSWGMARKTRIGPQQYLLTRTSIGQITLLIFLSQDGNNPYNDGPIVPSNNVQNNALIYSTVLYTCPESTNLGLTPANVNLNQITATQQEQIWHRMNTSLLGDTLQIGFTMSEEQMSTYTQTKESVAITGATQTNPCVLTCAGLYGAGQMISISEVEGMTELNYNDSDYNLYYVLSSTATEVTIDVDATGFGAYTTGGLATPVAPLIQFEELELHAFVMDYSPSALLA